MLKKLFSLLAVFGLLWACQNEEKPGGNDNGNPSKTSSVTVGTEQLSAVSAVLKGKANLGKTVAADLKIGFQYTLAALGRSPR